MENEIVTLCCGVYGGRVPVFPIEIARGADVPALQRAIFEKKRYRERFPFPAIALSLYVARKKNGDWLKNDDDADALLSGSVTTEYKLMRLNWTLSNPDCIGRSVLSPDDVHVLVELPERINVTPPQSLQTTLVLREKRTRDEWFVDKSLVQVPKKRKLNEGGKPNEENNVNEESKVNEGGKADEESHVDEYTNYFTMAEFPPLAHRKKKYNKVMERDAYKVIFSELIKISEFFLKAKADASIIVTGNPGTGKSRFYLYCIFQLVRGQNNQVKKLPPFVLVLNYGSDYYKYVADTDAFISLSYLELCKLNVQPNVVRLIDAESSDLVGWRGISILFASPGLRDMKDFAKAETSIFIMPVWSWEELQDYNALLDDPSRLPDDVLRSRYDKFGGIPRSIFTKSEERNEFDLNKALASFGALDIIAYAEQYTAWREAHYLHRVLAIVPTKSDYSDVYYLEFLSKHIAEEVFAKLNEESLQKVSEFAIAHTNDRPDGLSVMRGEFFKMFCHRKLNLPSKVGMQFRSLSSDERIELTIPDDMPMVRFSDLKNLEDDVRELPEKLTYYRPTSKTFGALDAFILDGESKKCYGLQMTVNPNHGIKAAPLTNFLAWLASVGIPRDHFYFCFVVPVALAPQYRKQTIRTNEDAEHKRPGHLTTIKQYVGALDVFIPRK